MTIHAQINATSANLIKLSELLVAAPELFAHAPVNIAQVDPKYARIYIHAYHADAVGVNWSAIALKYKRGNWQRRRSACTQQDYDWDGVLDGVVVSFLGVEKHEEPTPLFAVEGAAA